MKMQNENVDANKKSYLGGTWSSQDKKNRESYWSNREFFILIVFNIILQDYIERKNMWNKHSTDDDNSLGSFKFNDRGYIS